MITFKLVPGRPIAETELFWRVLLSGNPVTVFGMFRFCEPCGCYDGQSRLQYRTVKLKVYL